MRAMSGWRMRKVKYIGFLDDDDEFYPDHLNALTAQIVSSPSKIAYTDAEVVCYRNH